MSQEINRSEIANVASYDLYKYLALTKESFTPAKAKTQARKLLMKYHPDKNIGDETAERKFIMINIAYNILRNASSKEYYDLLREENEREEQDFEDVKSFDRSKMTYKTTMTEEQSRNAMRQKNLDLDPDFYNEKYSTKLSDNEVHSSTVYDTTLNKRMKEQFKQDYDRINCIENETKRQEAFDEMFSSTIAPAVTSTEITPFTQGFAAFGCSAGISVALATVDQTETMFSDVNTFDDQFLVHQHTLDTADEIPESIEDYERQYLASFKDDSRLSEKIRSSKLDGGRANFRFDVE